MKDHKIRPEALFLEEVVITLAFSIKIFMYFVYEQNYCTGGYIIAIKL